MEPFSRQIIDTCEGTKKYTLVRGGDNWRTVWNQYDLCKGTEENRRIRGNPRRQHLEMEIRLNGQKIRYVREWQMRRRDRGRIRGSCWEKNEGG